MSNYQRVGKVVHHCKWAAGLFHCRKSYLQGKGSTSTSHTSFSTSSFPSTPAAAPCLTRRVRLQRVTELKASSGPVCRRAYKQIRVPHGNYLAAAWTFSPWLNSNLSIIARSSFHSVLWHRAWNSLSLCNTTGTCCEQTIVLQLLVDVFSILTALHWLVGKIQFFNLNRHRLHKLLQISIITNKNSTAICSVM